MASVIHEINRPRRPWRVDWTEGGRRRTRRFATRREAQAFAGQTTRQTVRDNMQLRQWAEVWARQHFPAIEPTTRRGYSQLLDTWVLPWLGDVRIHNLDRQTVKAWRTHAVRDGATASIVNKAATVLGVVLAAAHDDGIIGSNPVARLRPLVHARQEVVPATIPQVEDIRLHLPTPRDRCFASLVAYAGLRPGEAVSLMWRDVRDMSVTVRRGQRTAGRTKTGSVRVVPTIGPVRDDLASLGAGHPDSLVLGVTHLSNWSGRVWRPARVRAGHEQVTLYSLRHTYASLLIAEGRVAHEVARLLGHSTPVLTLTTYGHLFDEAQLHAGESMEAAVVRGRAEAQIRHDASLSDISSS